MVVSLQEPAWAERSRGIGKNKTSSRDVSLLILFSTFEKEDCGSTTGAKHQASAVTAILGANDFFSELCLAGYPLRMSTAVALTASSIRTIKKEKMLQMPRKKNKIVKFSVGLSIVQP